jgi:glutathione S-transferase
VDGARARFETGVSVLEAALDGGEYLVGNSFSVADVVIGGVLTFARMSEVAALPPGIVPYIDGLEARPARQRAYTRTA